MKATTAYALVWLGVGLTISVGMIVSGSLIPLWAFLFPAMISMKD